MSKLLVHSLFLFIIYVLLFITDVTASSDDSSPSKKGDELYYNRVINILNAAKIIAKQYGHSKVLPIHILSSYIDSDSGASLLKENGIDEKALRNLTDIVLDNNRAGMPLGKKTKVTYSEETEDVLAISEKHMKKYGGKKVDVEHLLSGLSRDETVSEVFEEVNLSDESIKNILKNKFDVLKKKEKGDSEDQNFLEQFGTNLNEKIRKGKIPNIYGREEELRAIVESLCRLNKNSPVLVGHPGVGKTSIVEALAYRIEKNDVPKFLQGHTIISLNFQKFIAGTSYRGEFESRIKNIIKELKKKKKKLILFVDEIHLLLGAGKSEGGTDAANLLKPVLSKGQIKLIGATTIAEYKKHIENAPAFERRFEKIIIHPPSVDTTIKILRSLKQKYENFYGVRITDKALIATVKTADAFIKDRYLPDKAIDLLNKACAFIQVQLSDKPKVIDLTEREIRRMADEIATLEMDVDKVSRKKHQKLMEEFEKKKKELKDYYEEFKVTEERLQQKQSVEKELLRRKDKIHEYFQEKVKPPEEFIKELKRLQNEYMTLYKETAKYVEEKGHNAMNVDTLFQEHVSYVYLRDSGMPLGSLCFQSTKGVLKLYENLSKSIVGNEDIIKVISDSVIKLSAGMKDPERPIGAFLFLGPTGVGKTELAKALAVELFGSTENLIRINMSEYTEAHSVSKITGSPPGYVGFSEAGQLTEAVRDKPHSVVLFDELEKAHSDVFKVLLQILGDGYVNDNHRRHIDFSNTVIIMTSNLGFELFKKSLFLNIDKAGSSEYKKTLQEVRKHIIKKCKKFFKPEFVNRIDKISVFEPLTKDNLRKIVKLRFEKLEKRLELKNIFVSISDRAVDHIIDESFDPELGARPTLIFIESIIMTKLAILYMKKELLDDMDVLVDFNPETKNLVIHLSPN